MFAPRTNNGFLGLPSAEPPAGAVLGTAAPHSSPGLDDGGAVTGQIRGRSRWGSPESFVAVAVDTPAVPRPPLCELRVWGSKLHPLTCAMRL